MKVVAINGSPHMDEGTTALVLTPFLEGMSQAGADVELFYTRKLKINPCQGEGTCWIRTPGKCMHKDDVELLVPKMAEADVWVFATPVQVDGMTGPLKSLVDRLVAPLVNPFFEVRDGHCRHPMRDGTRSGRVVLVASCGLWELDNFDPLVAHMKAICNNVDRHFAGALLRPHGQALMQMMKGGMPVDDVLGAAGEAGRQLVVDGRVSAETLENVSRVLVPLEAHVQAGNQWLQHALGASRRGQEGTP
jgi:multimeric flavodoxin WrbA